LWQAADERSGRTTMNPAAMLRAFCDAVEQHNGAAFAALFTEMASITTVLCAFAGRAKIAEMIDDCSIARPMISAGTCTIVTMANTYARYTFSYRSNCPKQKALADVRGCRDHDPARC